MANMHEIRDRIKSINDIMKITNAMYLISSSKLKKAKKDLAATEPYFDKLVYAMRSILSRAPEDIDMHYFDRREHIPEKERKVGYLVITADKGMCGSYNHNIIKLTEQKIGTGQHNSLYVMGQIGRMYFQRKARAGELDVDPEFMYTPQNPTMYRARHIAEQILKEFDDGKLDDVYIIYTKMVTSITFEPKILQLLVKGLNPLYYYVAQFRDLIYGCHLPGPRIFFGGWIIAFLMLIIGVTVFQRMKDKFILYI